MVHYVVTWTIDIFGDQIECGAPTPCNAAKTAQHMLQEWDCDWCYDVKDVETDKMTRIALDVIDLDEENGKNTELSMKKEYRDRLIESNEQDGQVIKEFEELIKNSQHKINVYSAIIRKRTVEIGGLDAQIKRLECQHYRGFKDCDKRFA
jgi:hypothetical protein